MNEYLDLAWDLFGAVEGLVRRRADGWARVDGSSGNDKYDKCDAYYQSGG